MDNQGGGLLKTITFMSGLPTAQCFYFLVVIITPRIVQFYVLIKSSTDKERLLMTQKFTIQDLLQYYPKYEEGMDLNKDIVRNIQKCSDDFHALLMENKTLNRMTCLRDLDISLQCFYENAQGLLQEGRTDSLDIFGWYLTINDDFHYAKDKLRGKTIYV